MGDNDNRHRHHVQFGASPVPRQRHDPSGVGGIVSNAIGRAANPVLAAVDVDAIIQRVDVNELVSKVDWNAVVDEIDWNNLLDQIDLDALIDKVDVDRALERVDVNALIERSNLKQILARSSKYGARLPTVVSPPSIQIAKLTLLLVLQPPVCARLS